jgi:hypothetical protein
MPISQVQVGTLRDAGGVDDNTKTWGVIWDTGAPTAGNLLVGVLSVVAQFQTGGLDPFFAGSMDGWTTFGTWNHFIGNGNTWIGYKIADGADAATSYFVTGSGQNLGFAGGIGEFSGINGDSALDWSGTTYRFNNFDDAFATSPSGTSNGGLMCGFLFSGGLEKSPINSVAPFSFGVFAAVGSSTMDVTNAWNYYVATGAETRPSIFSWSGGIRRSVTMLTFNAAPSGGKILDRGLNRGINRGIFNG